MHLSPLLKEAFYATWNELWISTYETYLCHSWICLSFNFFPKATIFHYIYSTWNLVRKNKKLPATLLEKKKFSGLKDNKERINIHCNCVFCTIKLVSIPNVSPKINESYQKKRCTRNNHNHGKVIFWSFWRCNILNPKNLFMQSQKSIVCNTKTLQNSHTSSYHTPFF